MCYVHYVEPSVSDLPVPVRVHMAVMLRLCTRALGQVAIGLAVYFTDTVRVITGLLPPCRNRALRSGRQTLRTNFQAPYGQTSRGHVYG